MSDYGDTVRSSLSNVDDEERLERLQKGAFSEQAKVIALNILHERGYKQIDVGSETENKVVKKDINKVKFFSKDLAKVGAIGVVWYIVIVSGFSKFFIGIGITPIVTLAGMLGTLIVPIVPSYFVARFLSVHKGKTFLTTWVIGTVIICAISTIGMLNGQYKWW